MAGYSNRTWICPFFKYDKRLEVSCEAGKLCFPDREAVMDYAQHYCAQLNGWERCTLARALLRYYERQEENDGTERGQDQAPGA